MRVISNPISTAQATGARALDCSAPASQVGRLPSQRKIALSVAGEVSPRTPMSQATPSHSSSVLTKRHISVFRIVTGCMLGAAVGAVIGGPIGIIGGAEIGSAYVIIGPRAIAQAIQKAALMAYQHIQHYRASRQPVVSQPLASKV